jgi:hypothetical protein
VLALAATLNDVAVAPPPEVAENTQLPLELTVNANAKLEDQ